MDDERLFRNRLNDYIEKAMKTGRPIWTDFLNPAEQSMAISILDKNKNVIYAAFGGHEHCERRIFCILDCLSDIPPSFGMIKAIKIDFDAFNTKWITHRSILGAVLGLGCDRRMTGDIWINGQTAYIFLLENTAEFVQQHLVSVGRAHVSAFVVETDEADIGKVEETEKRLTVAALRMDAVIAGTFHLSRNKAVTLIEAEKVFLNWRMVKKPNETLKLNDVVSVRGVGRLILKDIGKQSAKGRTWIELSVY